MEYKEIQDLLKLVNKTDLTEVEIEQKDFRLRIRRKPAENNVVYSASSQPFMHTQPAIEAPATPMAQGSPTPSPAEAASESVSSEDLYVFRSPMIGTLYRSPTPESDVFVNVGDYVQKGQVLCIIEAMKLFNEIESEVEGKIIKILIDNAHPVEYDQELFLIDPNA